MPAGRNCINTDTRYILLININISWIYEIFSGEINTTSTTVTTEGCPNRPTDRHHVPAVDLHSAPCEFRVALRLARHVDPPDMSRPVFAHTIVPPYISSAHAEFNGDRTDARIMTVQIMNSHGPMVSRRTSGRWCIMSVVVVIVVAPYVESHRCRSSHMYIWREVH